MSCRPGDAAFSLTVSGSVTVSDGGGSISIDGTVAATQSGAWSVSVTGQVDVTPSSPSPTDYLPVRLTDGANFITGGGGGGTEFAEDTAHTSGAKGTLIFAVRRDADTSLVDTDGDYAPLQVAAGGALKTAVIGSVAVTDGGGSVTVDGTAPPGRGPRCR